MVPKQINHAIQQGQILYAPGPENLGLGAIITRAKSRNDRVYVQTKERPGWSEITELRRAGQNFTTAVFAVGDLTWHSN